MVRFRYFLHLGQSLRRIIKNFFDNDDYAKASALSFYTLLSLVPVLAVAFGIAKGFGFEQILENQILETFYQQQVFAEKLIEFARSTLEQARGSLIAGVGVLLLFWTALGVLGNFERALNSIWKVSDMRSFFRRTVDYLPILIFSPIFLVASSSLTFFLIRKLMDISSSTGIYPQIKPLFYFSYYALLMLITWVFLIFLYTYLPNKYVPWRSCVFAALIAASLFQLMQWAYIHLQIYLTQYNAIYGSFAAVPLFLLWIQISWIIILAGAEIAYDHAMYAQTSLTSLDKTLITEQELYLLIIALCCKHFHEKNPLIGAAGLAQELNVSQAVIEKCLRRCIDAELIVEATDKEGRIVLFPTTDPDSLHLSDVYKVIDGDRNLTYEIADIPLFPALRKAMHEWEDQGSHLPSNLAFSELIK